MSTSFPMTAAQLTMVTGLISLVYFMAMWLGPRVVRDFYACKMCELRMLLIKTASGSEEFRAHPAYQLLLHAMTGYIRGGNRLTLPAVLVANMIIKHRAFDGYRFEDRWEKAMHEGSDEVREKLAFFRHRMYIVNIRKLVISWLPLMPLLFLVLLVIACVKAVAEIATHLWKRASKLPHERTHAYKMDVQEYVREPMHRMDNAALMYAQNGRRRLLCA